MTLIVGLSGRDGVLIGADSRGTIGDPRGLTAINDTQNKIFKLNDYCGVAIAGMSEIAVNLLDGLQRLPALQQDDCADRTLEITRGYIRDKYNEWFQAFPVDKRPGILMILAGYAKIADDRKDRIYLLNSQFDFAPQLFPSGFALAGVPQYAVYLLHRLYDKKMGLNSLKSLAVYIVAETATQDPKVGGPIRIATIKPSGGYSELTEDEIESIMKRNAEQSKKLRAFFFEEPRGTGEENVA